jgi:uncharacterized BrkB/YihY/UPF0761 family membrane protein
MRDGRFDLWHKWLLAACAIIIVFGLVMALLSWTPLFSIFNSLVDDVFWPDREPAGLGQYRLWVHGMLGATMAGWGITLAYIVLNPFAKREKWSWNAIAAGMAVWFIVDTLMSVYTKAYFNVGVNVLLIVLAGIPLVMSWKYFAGKKRLS